jgi:hypothetical protein
MFDEVQKLLSEKGFVFNIGMAHRDCHHINIGQRKEILRFLGSIRPKRLLPKFNADLLGQMSMRTVKLVSKEFIGNQIVVAIKTDTGTYMAEGLASHNCDEAYIVIDQIDSWMNPATDPLNIPLLKEYLAALGAMPSTKITVSSLKLPAGTVGKPYTAALAAAGGVLPYTWSIQSGQLPKGLNFAPSGQITGVPLVVGRSGNITFICTDADGNATGIILTIQIKGKCIFL